MIGMSGLDRLGGFPLPWSPLTGIRDYPPSAGGNLRFCLAGEGHTAERLSILTSSIVDVIFLTYKKAP